MTKTIDFISCGEVFSGEGFNAPHHQGGRMSMFVRNYDNDWFTTNNKDWEPECPVLPTVTFNIFRIFIKLFFFYFWNKINKCFFFQN